jgi:hypothetical protein
MSNDGEVRTGASGRDYTVKTSAKGIDYVRGVAAGARDSHDPGGLLEDPPQQRPHSDLSLNLGRYRRRTGELQPVRDSPPPPRSVAIPVTAIEAALRLDRTEEAGVPVPWLQ